MKTPPLKSLLSRYLAVAILLTATFVQGYQAPTANALGFSTRSLTLQPGLVYGGSTPAQDVNHEFTFIAPTSTAVQSIMFEYCDQAADPDPTGIEVCNAPSGLDAGTGVTLSAPGGWSIGASAPSNTAPYITRATPADISAGITVTFLAVLNPTAINTTFFVRIKTYTTADRSGSITDRGTVAASTARPIVVKGTMPESLVFCTGENIDMIGVSTVPDCTTATDGEVYFDTLFSPQVTSKAQSEMAASTNAGAGYVITISGPTLTTGISTTIAAMGTPGSPGTPAAPALGVAQFGINLVDNGVFGPPYPDIGAGVTSAANGTNFKGQAAAGYDTVDAYLFDPAGGDTVANSFNGGAGGSDGQIFTVSYIVNVPGSQPAGDYETTLTYICTPTF